MSIEAVGSNIYEARRAIYAGSFDPPTNGHAWVIEQGAAMFEELHVAVGVNPDKRTWFSAEERIEMLEDISKPFSNVTVGQFEMEYLVNFADRTGYGTILRGLRSTGDFSAEQTMTSMNRDIRPGIRTAFVICPDELAKISSSSVKSLLGFEEWETRTSKYVSSFVRDSLKRAHEARKGSK